MSISKPAIGWIRWTAILPILAASGCVSVVNDSAICHGTEVSRTAHAAALAEDGGDMSVVTGAYLIRQIDAACQ